MHTPVPSADERYSHRCAPDLHHPWQLKTDLTDHYVITFQYNCHFEATTRPIWEFLVKLADQLFAFFARIRHFPALIFSNFRVISISKKELQIGVLNVTDEQTLGFNGEDRANFYSPDFGW